jgi:hypothetical protein
MINKVRSWFSENQTLVYFLIAQAVAIASAGLGFTAYMVRLETRVATLETRGSPHLSDINTRLTVLEGQTRNNKDSIDRVVDVMTKELHVSPKRDSK